MLWSGTVCAQKDLGNGVELNVGDALMRVEFVKNADDDVKKALRTVAWYVDCGDDDFLFDEDDEEEDIQAVYVPKKNRNNKRNSKKNNKKKSS